jgi:dephospho-CoA kinase
MPRIGLTGGIASGKSTVCGLLREWGCYIIDADKVAHELMLKSQPCYEPVVEAFGEKILDSAGQIDRLKLGSIAFEDQALLGILNKIVHPHVIGRILTQLEILESKHPQRTIVVDASLLIESGFYKSFKRVVVVTCTPEQQIERLISRNGYSQAQARQRIAVQMPLEQKRRFADYVIDNSGSLEQTKAQVDALVKEWSINPWTM